MASHNPFSYDSFILGNKDELAIFMEDQNEERIFNLKNPKVTNVTIEEERNYSERQIEISHGTVRPDSKAVTFPKSRHIKATITIETTDWEAVWGDEVRSELPDTVKNMSVEELLHALNKKLQEEK